MPPPQLSGGRALLAPSALFLVLRSVETETPVH